MKKNTIIALINMYRDLEDFNNIHEEFMGNKINNELFLSFLDIPQVIISDLQPDISENTSDILYDKFMHLLNNKQLSPAKIYDVMINFL